MRLHPSTQLIFLIPLLLSSLMPPAQAEPQPIVFTSTAEQDAAEIKGWDTNGGQWSVTAGHLSVRNPDTDVTAMALPHRAPLLDTQTVEGTVNVRERLTPAGWSLAGISIYDSPDEYWVLCLTEGEGGKRYVDFLENSHGIWQAQLTDGPTRLSAAAVGITRHPWTAGRDYHLQLDLTPVGISAAVTDTGTRDVIAAGSYTFGAAEAVRQGTAGLIARGCAADLGPVTVRAPEAAPALPAEIKVENGPHGAVAMMRDTLPGMDLATVDSLARRLRTAGFGVTFLSAQNVTDPSVLDPARFPVYIIPNSAVYPAAGGRALQAYLRRSGRLVLLGGPPFSHPVWMKNGEWLDAETIQARLAKTPTDHIYREFRAGEDLSGWAHNTNDPAIPSTIRIDPAGPEDRGASLKFTMDNFTDWSTYTSPPFGGGFAPGQELLTFWAKGDAHTPQLSVEMDETDGSRWIAVTPLTTDWSYHVLAPDDFHYWKDSNTKPGRGGPGDRFHPQWAARMVLGLARSHTKEVGSGPHTFWVARFGTAANPYAVSTGGASTFPTIETVYPSYKLYPLTSINTIKVAPGGAMLPALERFLPSHFPPSIDGPRNADYLPMPAHRPLFSCIERPTGSGFGSHSRWRWIPLLEARDAAGQQRGTPAWILLNETVPFAGSAVAVFGFQDQSFFRDPVLSDAVVDTVKLLKQGIFLTAGGTKEFSYFPGEKVQLGATVTNWGDSPAQLQWHWSINTPNGSTEVFSPGHHLIVGAGDSETVTETWDPGKMTGSHSVKVELSKDDRMIDSISHGFSLLPASVPSRDDFVTVKGSDFMLHGKQWNPVGVNFWPLYASGLEPGDYRNHWLARGFYDPDEVDRDLDRVKALGMNMVSIQMGGVENIRNTLDFLRRCDRHGLKANGFLNGASPLDFNEREAGDIIRAGHLDQNSTLFAYDTIWEPGNSVFDARGRPRWDRDWERWIMDRYDSVQNAETDWGMPVPRTDGKITSPSDVQMSTDGPWRVMVAAYRRFMDDLISRKWNDASRSLGALDPNHLISFRQGNTLPQDFAFTGPVKHIDFISPEGYSIPASESGYNAAAFTIRYLHFTTGGKPIFWAEFGRSVWNGERMQPDEAVFHDQGEYIELFNRASLDAGANGLAPWWWPGGYRVDEKSDFGITNLDGTPRPAAEVIRRYAPRLESPSSYPAPDTWLTIDRDAHPGGYWWIIFHEGAEAYAHAHAAGHNLGVHTAGTGTNSANTPLVAVGNRPYSGHNPLKYLDAEFNWLRIQDRNGKWVDVQEGAEIPVAPGKEVTAWASVGNTQEATWLCPGSPGSREGLVFLGAPQDAGSNFRRPITQNTPYLADAEFGPFQLTPGITTRTPFALQMTVYGRAWFGEKRTFTLVPGG